MAVPNNGFALQLGLKIRRILPSLYTVYMEARSHAEPKFMSGSEIIKTTDKHFPQMMCRELCMRKTGIEN